METYAEHFVAAPKQSPPSLSDDRLLQIDNYVERSKNKKVIVPPSAVPSKIPSSHPTPYPSTHPSMVPTRIPTVYVKNGSNNKNNDKDKTAAPTFSAKQTQTINIPTYECAFDFDAMIGDEIDTSVLEDLGKYLDDQYTRILDTKGSKRIKQLIFNTESSNWGSEWSHRGGLSDVGISNEIVSNLQYNQTVYVRFNTIAFISVDVIDSSNYEDDTLDVSTSEIQTSLEHMIIGYFLKSSHSSLRGEIEGIQNLTEVKFSKFVVDEYEFAGAAGATKNSESNLSSENMIFGIIGGVASFLICALLTYRLRRRKTTLKNYR